MFYFFYDNFFSNPFEETCFSWGGKAGSAVRLREERNEDGRGSPM